MHDGGKRILNCTNCGSELPRGAAYCASCGRKVANANDLPVEGGRQNAPRDDEGGPLSGPPAGTELKDGKAIPRAPIFRRLSAGAIDVAIILALYLVFARFRLLARVSFTAMVPFLVPCIYALLRDGFGGRSIGKALLGLRVVNVRTMRPGGVAESILRNWYFAIITVPPKLAYASLGLFLFWVLVLIVTVQIASGARRRLGDGWANTQVTSSP